MSLPYSHQGSGSYLIVSIALTCRFTRGGSTNVLAKHPPLRSGRLSKISVSFNSVGWVGRALGGIGLTPNDLRDNAQEHHGREDKADRSGRGEGRGEGRGVLTGACQARAHEQQR